MGTRRYLGQRVTHARLFEDEGPSAQHRNLRLAQLTRLGTSTQTVCPSQHRSLRAVGALMHPILANAKALAESKPDSGAARRIFVIIWVSAPHAAVLCLSERNEQTRGSDALTRRTRYKFTVHAGHGSDKLSLLGPSCQASAEAFTILLMLRVPRSSAEQALRSWMK